MSSGYSESLHFESCNKKKQVYIHKSTTQVPLDILFINNSKQAAHIQ